jgi:hypothetical protein
MKGRCVLPFAAVALLACATAASGQVDATVALGGGIAFYHPLDDQASNAAGVALAYRFGKPTGWRPTFGLNWITIDFATSVAGERTPLGDLRLRPIMGGYVYGVQRGRLAVSGSLLAGYAFNSFEVDDRARLAYDRALGTTLLRVSASNSLAARTEMALWYDISSRFGVQGIVGFIASRPKVAIVDDGATTTRRLRADAVKLEIALVYGIF